jgi:hypothetical protein
MVYVLDNFEKDPRLFDLLQYYHEDISDLGSTQISRVKDKITALHIACWEN